MRQPARRKIPAGRWRGVLAAGFAALWLGVHPASASDSDPVLERVREYRANHEAEILGEFAELLGIPNVARDTENIRRNAARIAELFARRGVETELWSLPQAPDAPPIVFGRLPRTTRTENPRRIGIYVHYDGQPVDASQWTHPAWTPTLYDRSIEAGGKPVPMPAPGDRVDPEARLYARSSGDDKAPLSALLAALDGLATAGIEPSTDVVFLFEGEEEAGSPHLGTYFDQHREELEVDLWIICDGPVHQSRRPQLVFGVRGYTGLDITVFGATRYLHSGHYGNWAPNPGQQLATLLASMKDGSGHVLVDGFYDSTWPLSSADRRAVAALPAVDTELRKELGLHTTEAGNATLAERILLPSLNVRGMQSGAVGAAARNVIPTEATAAIDIRLAAGNDPDDMLDRVEAHIRSQGYHIVRQEPDQTTRLSYPKIAKVVRRPGYPAARTEIGHAAVQPVLRAATRAGGEPPLLVPTLGGSLPLYLFTDKLEAPIVIAPIANHDNNQHAPDENIRVANLWYGIDLMAALLTME